MNKIHLNNRGFGRARDEEKWFTRVIIAMCIVMGIIATVVLSVWVSIGYAAYQVAKHLAH